MITLSNMLFAYPQRRIFSRKWSTFFPSFLGRLEGDGCSGVGMLEKRYPASSWFLLKRTLRSTARRVWERRKTEMFYQTRRTNDDSET